MDLDQPRPQVTRQKVEVIWGNQWWQAELLETNGMEYHIHYTGWDSSFDEWMTKDRIYFPTVP